MRKCTVNSEQRCLATVEKARESRRRPTHWQSIGNKVKKKKKREKGRRKAIALTCYIGSCIRAEMDDSVRRCVILLMVVMVVVVVVKVI